MLVSACLPPARSCLAWQAGRLRRQARRAGILVFKGIYPYFIQHQASSIQYLVHYGINVRFHDFVILVPACPVHV
jgi:hypothetical protein